MREDFEWAIIIYINYFNDRTNYYIWQSQFQSDTSEKTWDRNFKLGVAASWREIRIKKVTMIWGKTKKRTERDNPRITVKRGNDSIEEKERILRNVHPKGQDKVQVVLLKIF